MEEETKEREKEAAEDECPEKNDASEQTGQAKEKKQKKDTNKKEAKESAKLKEELVAQKDAYLRLAAEYDNYRRRSMKEREDTYADAYADVIKQVLPIADNLERALKYADSDKVVEGVQMTYNKFLQTLSNMGIEEIECTSFDPNFHNAVMHVEDEARGESEIVEVFEKGYKKGDKVIRYAMVKVAN